MALICTLGCGSYSPPRDEADAGVDGPPLTDGQPACDPRIELDVARFGRQFYDAVCTALLRCDLFTTFESVEECAAHHDRYYDGIETKYLRGLLEAVDHRLVDFDAVAAERCFAELRTAACPVSLDTPACQSIFAGRTPPGAACFSQEECAAAGGQCVGLDAEQACRPGTCSASAALGQPCAEATPCVPGAHCVAGGEGGAARCEAGELGSRCTENRDCDRALWCQQGSCTADLAPGAACRFDAECAGGSLCVGEQRAATGTCSRVSVEGDVCDDYCFGAMFCELPQLGENGSCRPLPKLGEDCFVSMGRCAGVALYCSSQDICTPLPASGEACSRGTFCQAGLFCSTELDAEAPQGTCLALGGDGQPCVRDGNCASYDCGAQGKCQAPASCRGAAPTDPCL